MQSLFGVLLKLVTKHQNETAFKPGHIAVHIADQIERELSDGLSVSVYTA